MADQMLHAGRRRELSWTFQVQGNGLEVPSLFIGGLRGPRTPFGLRRLRGPQGESRPEDGERDGQLLPESHGQKETNELELGGQPVHCSAA